MILALRNQTRLLFSESLRIFSMTADASNLFQPTKVGDLTLNTKIVLAPLTRFRANKTHAHTDLAVQYYDQRASYPGTLLITEATFIAAKAGGYNHVPGIWNDGQVAAWKKVTDAVHARGSYIYLQLWALGRAALESVLKEEDPYFPFVSASDILLSGHQGSLRPLTVPEIKEYVQLYATAAANAVHKAGFDGVEVHGANGYLIDQFIQDVTNKRTDEYGGSIENRCRFALEVIDAVVQKVGETKTGLRISPWGRAQEMRMSNPVPTFSYLIDQLKTRFPKFAYLHAVEPRVMGSNDAPEVTEGDTNDIFRSIWGDRPFISAGGYKTPEDISETVGQKGGLVAIGRYYISNPDLPYRIKKGLPWTPYDRKMFYIEEAAEGYIDYPPAESS